MAGLQLPDGCRVFPSMPLATRALAVFLLLPATGCVVTTASGTVERPVKRSFAADGTSVVRVKVSGGSIRVRTSAGSSDQVEVTLTARVRADSESEATSILSGYDVVLEQQGAEVIASARRQRNQDWSLMLGNHGNVQFKAEIVAPAHVALDLDTSGGAITVNGERTGVIHADTSGGAINVDGGSGDIALDTSGGGITVGRALGLLKADTSGGRIKVDYVGPSARNVDLDTSGGGISVGVDPAASLRISAQTSGGGVSIDGLPLVRHSKDRQHVTGIINGGNGALRASTSGGSIRITAVDDGRASSER